MNYVSSCVEIGIAIFPVGLKIGALGPFIPGVDKHLSLIHI